MASVADYETVETAKNVAIELKKLIERFARTTERMNMPTAQHDAILSNGNSGGDDGQQESASTFEIKEHHLIRNGWSKKKNEPYVHKVSKSIFDRVVVLMQQLAAKEKVPVAAEILTQRLATDGNEPIPSYQVYVVLGFLKDRGIITQLGREGYAVPADFKSRLKDLWSR